MFHRLITKYGLATHLALLASLPVAIQPFVSDRALGITILWLSAFAIMWLMVEPSILSGEHLSTARERVRKELVASPLFWFSLIVVAFAAVRCWNDGVALRFDAAQSAWLVSQPDLSGLPAAVQGAAFLPFAVAVGTVSLMLGILYGLGLAARLSFGIVFSFLMGVGGLAVATCVCFEMEPLTSMAATDFSPAPHLGTAFGIGCLVAIACGTCAESRKWTTARFPFCVAVAGNVAGLLFLAPSLVSAGYLAVSIVLALFGIVIVTRTASAGGAARCAMMILLGVAIAVSLLVAYAPRTVWDAKVKGLDATQAFPETYRQESEILGRASRAVWEDSPWCGGGIGSFPLRLKFLADKADWSVLKPDVASPSNGYWSLLAERGILGCLFLAGIGVFLIVVWVKHLVGAILYLRTRDDAFPFPFACAPVVWISLPVLVLLGLEAVADPVFSGKTVLLAAVVGIALPAASFPRKPRRQTPETDQEK